MLAGKRKFFGANISTISLAVAFFSFELARLEVIQRSLRVGSLNGHSGRRLLDHSFTKFIVSYEIP